MHYNRIDMDYIHNFGGLPMNELTLDNKIMPVVVSVSSINEPTNKEEYIYDCYALYIVTEGQVKIIEQDITYTLNKGSLLFTSKALSHTLTPATTPFCVNCYKFNMEAQTSGTTGTFILPKILHNISDSILFEKAALYMKMFNSGNYYLGLDINVKFYDILSECIKLNNNYHPGQTNLSDHIANYLHEHINEQLNTKNMEKHFYLTYKYMGTAFKKETGYTILNYHTMLRMKSAAHLLLTTTGSIDEISRQLGYSDALYFSRIFKKHYLVPPQVYRKNTLKNHTPT